MLLAGRVSDVYSARYVFSIGFLSVYVSLLYLVVHLADPQI